MTVNKKELILNVTLVCGLGSSIPIIGTWMFQRWAKKLKKRITTEFPNSIVNIYSSDGNDMSWMGRAFNTESFNILNNVNYLNVIIGHSNGFRDGLKYINYRAKTPVQIGYNNVIDYFCGIDMTLAYQNRHLIKHIKHFHCFYGALQREPLKKLSKSIGSICQTKIKSGHIAMANDNKVQGAIMQDLATIYRQESYKL